MNSLEQGVQEELKSIFLQSPDGELDSEPTAARQVVGPSRAQRIMKKGTHVEVVGLSH